MRNRTKDNIKFGASICAYISVIIVISLFLYEQHVEKQFELRNERILIENLIFEIEKNLDFIKYFEDNKDKFNTTYEWPIDRFSFVILDQAIEELKTLNKSIRNGMYQIYFGISLQNSHLDFLNKFGFIKSEEEGKAYMGLKSEQIKGISENNIALQYNFELLRNELQLILKN